MEWDEATGQWVQKQPAPDTATRFGQTLGRSIADIRIGGIGPSFGQIIGGIKSFGRGEGFGTGYNAYQPQSAISQFWSGTKKTAPSATAAQLPNVPTELEKFMMLNARPTSGMGGVNAQIKANEEAARRYWANVQNYGQARSSALNEMYSQLAGTTARAGADIGQRGLESAANIEQIYQNLADQAARLGGGGGGMVTPETATSGLVPLSGEAAMAAQQIPTAGASLADYLAGTSGVQSSMMDALARAQTEEGVANIADYLNTIATSKAAADYQRAQQAADLRRQASAAYASANAQWEAGRRAAEFADKYGPAISARSAGQAYLAADKDSAYKKWVDSQAGGSANAINWITNNGQLAATQGAVLGDPYLMLQAGVTGK